MTHSILQLVRVRPRRRGRWWLLGLLAALALAGCDRSGDGGDDASDASPRPVATGTPDGQARPTLPPSPDAASSEPLKPVMTGLVDRQEPPAPGQAGIVDGFVVTVPWAQLHPSPGVLATSTALDDAIATARTAQPELQLKLRILGGINAPDWVSRIGGEPFVVTEPHSGVSGAMGRFWEPEYGLAYDELQRLLAERYDDVEVLREVTMSRCTTVFAEPLIRHMADPGVADVLLDEGYTREADLQCQQEQFAAHTAWEQTRSGFAVNPYQSVDPAGSEVDVDATVVLMKACRDVLGGRCVLENNSIRTPTLGGDMQVMYDAMEGLGAPLTFQTAAPGRVGDLGETLEWAARRGASAVELPRGWESLLPPEGARRVDIALAANT